MVHQAGVIQVSSVFPPDTVRSLPRIADTRPFPAKDSGRNRLPCRQAFLHGIDKLFPRIRLYPRSTVVAALCTTKHGQLLPPLVAGLSHSFTYLEGVEKAAWKIALGTLHNSPVRHDTRVALRA